MEEIWKNIIDYETYSVSNLGNIKNIVTGLNLKGCKDKDGYLRVDLWKNRIRKTFRIHRIVALAFHENPDDKKIVDHIDGNVINNNLINLRWATVTENSRNAKMKVTNTSGVKGIHWNKNAKKWSAEIRIDGKNYHLGYFDTIEEATAVRQKNVAEHYGEFTNACEKI